MESVSRLPAVVGLIVSLGAPLLLFAIEPETIWGRLLGQLAILGIVAVTVANVVLWEGRPMSSFRLPMLRSGIGYCWFAAAINNWRF